MKGHMRKRIDVYLGSDLAAALTAAAQEAGYETPNRLARDLIAQGLAGRSRQAAQVVARLSALADDPTATDVAAEVITLLQGPGGAEGLRMFLTGCAPDAPGLDATRIYGVLSEQLVAIAAAVVAARDCGMPRAEARDLQRSAEAVVAAIDTALIAPAPDHPEDARIRDAVALARRLWPEAPPPFTALETRLEQAGYVWNADLQQWVRPHP